MNRIFAYPLFLLATISSFQSYSQEGQELKGFISVYALTSIQTQEGDGEVKEEQAMGWNMVFSTKITQPEGGVNLLGEPYLYQIDFTDPVGGCYYIYTVSKMVIAGNGIYNLTGTDGESTVLIKWDMRNNFFHISYLSGGKEQRWFYSGVIATMECGG